MIWAVVYLCVLGFLLVAIFFIDPDYDYDAAGSILLALAWPVVLSYVVIAKVCDWIYWRIIRGY